MDLQGAFASLKKAYAYSKDVEIEELDLKLTLEPPTNIEEQKVLEACSDLDGGEYLDGIKNHTLSYSIKKLSGNDIPEFIPMMNEDGSPTLDEDGKPREKTRYLFLFEEISTWTSPLRDKVFDAYQDLLFEIQDKVDKNVTFDRFQIATTEVTSPVPEKFTRVEEPEDDSNLTPEELLEKQIKKEQDNVAAGMAQTESEVIDRELSK